MMFYQNNQVKASKAFAFMAVATFMNGVDGLNAANISVSAGVDVFPFPIPGPASYSSFNQIKHTCKAIEKHSVTLDVTSSAAVQVIQDFTSSRERSKFYLDKLFVDNCKGLGLDIKSLTELTGVVFSSQDSEPILQETDHATSNFSKDVETRVFDVHASSFASASAYITMRSRMEPASSDKPSVGDVVQIQNTSSSLDGAIGRILDVDPVSTKKGIFKWYDVEVYHSKTYQYRTFPYKENQIKVVPAFGHRRDLVIEIDAFPQRFWGPGNKLFGNLFGKAPGTDIFGSAVVSFQIRVRPQGQIIISSSAGGRSEVFDYMGWLAKWLAKKMNLAPDQAFNRLNEQVAKEFAAKQSHFFQEHVKTFTKFDFAESFLVAFQNFDNEGATSFSDAVVAAQVADLEWSRWRDRIDEKRGVAEHLIQLCSRVFWIQYQFNLQENCKVERDPKKLLTEAQFIKEHLLRLQNGQGKFFALDRVGHLINELLSKGKPLSQSPSVSN